MKKKRLRIKDKKLEVKVRQGREGSFDDFLELLRRAVKRYKQS